MTNNQEKLKTFAFKLDNSNESMCEVCKKEEISFYLSIPDLKMVCQECVLTHSGILHYKLNSECLKCSSTDNLAYIFPNHQTLCSDCLKLEIYKPIENLKCSLCSTTKNINVVVPLMEILCFNCCIGLKLGNIFTKDVWECMECNDKRCVLYIIYIKEGFDYNNMRCKNCVGKFVLEIRDKMKPIAIDKNLIKMIIENIKKDDSGKITDESKKILKNCGVEIFDKFFNKNNKTLIPAEKTKTENIMGFGIDILSKFLEVTNAPGTNHGEAVLNNMDVFKEMITKQFGSEVTNKVFDQNLLGKSLSDIENVINQIDIYSDDQNKEHIDVYKEIISKGKVLAQNSNSVTNLMKNYISMFNEKDGEVEEKVE